MPVQQLLLYVNEYNIIPEIHHSDVTADWLYDGKISIDIGVPYALRHFWIKMIDDSGNSSIRYLGSYRTEDHTPPDVTGSLSNVSPLAHSLSFDYDIEDESGQITGAKFILTTTPSQPTYQYIDDNGDVIDVQSTNLVVSGLDEQTEYYGWIAVSDAADNKTVAGVGSAETSWAFSNVEYLQGNSNVYVASGFTTDYSNVDFTFFVSETQLDASTAIAISETSGCNLSELSIIDNPAGSYIDLSVEGSNLVVTQTYDGTTLDGNVDTLYPYLVSSGAGTYAVDIPLESLQFN
ncbi:hypothetical protein TetV_543 [Tetraselmis virus 1]|uniref:Uncharacterized protein n=1 Tax=Tetraselmis virus 1 TaxID=2060617 RepID=A0A2P0VP00_9VIRU|nr:hypothetical protein QJ968_gp511 [Tetraselmis virus 1]AUF82625.1 hypothetical protein TetV_543 [Tetraselmis virus 1]